MADIENATTIDWYPVREQASDPSTPTSGLGRIYEKTDKQFYGKDSAGTAKRLSGANVSIANVTTPTDAELDSAFGTPAVVGAGFIGVVNDNNGDTNVYFVFSTGTSWFFVTGTKAT